MNHKVEKEKEFEEDLMPAQLEKLEEGRGTLSREGGIIGGVDCLLKGGMTSSVWCPTPSPLNENPAQYPNLKMPYQKHIVSIF